MPKRVLSDVFKDEQRTVFLKAVKELEERMKEGDKSKKDLVKELDIPRGMRSLTVFQNLENIAFVERINQRATKESIPLVGITDNSNTQFALLALWVTQPYDIPLEPTFRLLVQRFERSQLHNGQWSYPYVRIPNRSDEITGRPSMTCVGLLALAIGRGLKLPKAPGSRPGIKEDLPIVAGLAALNSMIGAPQGQWDRPVRVQDPNIADIYYLWSLERVAMVFNLPTFAGKEWYRWGTELLVTNQLESGEFETADWSEDAMFSNSPVRGFYGPILKTAFALLFLKHSHPMKDLTPKLPFTAKELNEGIARLRPGNKFPAQTLPSPSQNTKPEPSRNRGP